MDTEVDEETVLQMMLEEHDEDAQFVQDFEEQVSLTCQDCPEHASSQTQLGREDRQLNVQEVWPTRSLASRMSSQCH